MVIVFHNNCLWFDVFLFGHYSPLCTLQRPKKALATTDKQARKIIARPKVRNFNDFDVYVRTNAP